MTAMASIIVLIKLNEGVDADSYEAWARDEDMPTIRALSTVRRFDILRFRGTAAELPYDYAEIAAVEDLEAFQKEVSSDAVQAKLADFAGYCSAPVLLVGESI